MHPTNNILLQQIKQDLKLRGVKNYHFDFLVAENPKNLKVSANEMLYLYYFGSYSNQFQVKIISELNEHIYHPQNCRKISTDFFESHYITKHLSDITFQSEGSFFIHFLKVKILPHEKN